eukprot:345263-Prymnesium_polylepis.1
MRLRAVGAGLQLERLEHGVHARSVHKGGVFLRLAAEHALREGKRKAAAHAHERHQVRHEPKRAVLLGDEEVGTVSVAT